MKAHWPVALAAVGIVGAMLLFFIRRQPPPHPFWFWFGVAVMAGLILDRWSALWLTTVPSVTILGATGWPLLRNPPSVRGDFGSDTLVVTVAIAVWLVVIGLLGILIGFASRAILRGVASKIEF